MGSTAVGQNGPGSNDNEGVHHIPQSSKTGALHLDAVQCHVQDTYWGGGGGILTPLQRYICYILQTQPHENCFVRLV